MAAWWGTRENVSSRLEKEYIAMLERFRKTFSLTVPERGELFWTGTVYLNLSGIKVREHTLRIVYPTRFPYVAADCYIVQPRIVPEKFQYEDGHLSLFNPKEGVDYGWNPSRSTASTIAIWGIEWLYSYYVYKITGNWPEKIGGRDKPKE